MGLDYPKEEYPRKVYPLYHKLLVPTFADAIDIFEPKQLEKIKVDIRQSQSGLYMTVVQLCDTKRDSALDIS